VVHGIFLAHLLGLTVFFHNLSPSLLWPASGSYTFHFIIHAFITQSFLSFLKTCPYHHKLRWHGQVLRKDESDWVKKCMDYEVEGVRPRGRPKKIWECSDRKRLGCQTRQIFKKDPTDHRKWRKL